MFACPRCGASVPQANASLHEARCGGQGTAPPQVAPAPAPGPAQSLGALGGEAINQQIVQELTWARTRPQEVIEALRGRLAQYKGKEYFPPERGGASVVTKEGTAVVEEAIEYIQGLETMDGVGSRSEEGLALAAEDHVADIGQTGTASHTSSDGTSAPERASQYGHYGLFGECLWYGSDLADARTIVLDLIIDDGVPSRGHRKGVLNPRYDAVGVAYGPHVTFGRMAAMEFARFWEPDAMFIRSRLQTGPRKIDARIMAQAKDNAETQWSLGTCPICGEAIKGGKVVEVPEMHAKLHGDCFKCSSCARSLLGGVEKRCHGKQLYCKECFLEKHGDSCSACGKVIAGAMVTCALGKLHVECLICSTCNKCIGKASFSTTGGVINCQDCSAAASGPAPGRKASSPPVSRPGSGRSRTLGAAGAATMAASPRAPAAKAGSKAKAKPKPAPKMSMGKAQTSTMAIAMDYASLG